MSSFSSKLGDLWARLPPLWLGGITDWPGEYEHEGDREVAREGIHTIINDAPFQTSVVFAAGMGFLTDAYDIFAVNLVLPMISYVYWGGAYAMPHGLWTLMICATLFGSMIGQIAFGILGDIFGRKRVYGWELIIILWATIGLASSSTGSNHSMSISTWLIFWRLMMGIGIGGDYPLSAVITSEFAPKQHRARMLALVFFMQPVGQFLGTVFATAVIYGYRHHIPRDATACGVEYTISSDRTACISSPDCQAVDKAWRVIVGLGGVPGLLAVWLRLTIPESPRYTLDVLEDKYAAERDTARHYRPRSNASTPSPRPPSAQGSTGSRFPPDHILLTPLRTSHMQGLDIETAQNGSAEYVPSGHAVRHRQNGTDVRVHEARNSTNAASDRTPPRIQEESIQGQSNGNPNPPNPPLQDPAGQATPKRPPIYDFIPGFKRHFSRDHNWMHLVGTMFSWFLLDFAFYGLGMSSTATIQKLFWGLLTNDSRKVFTNPLNPHSVVAIDSRVVYQVLYENGWHSLIVVSLGALAGGATLIYLIEFTRPVKIQALFFFLLGLLMFVVGGTFKPILTSTSSVLKVPWPLIIMYIICQFLFNLGANSTTFIIPAEQFPTRYRCTCNGLSAASGKFASFLVQISLYFWPFHIWVEDSKTQQLSKEEVHWDNPASVGLGRVLMIFGSIMLLGTLVTVFLVPDSRFADGRNPRSLGAPMSLEDLALGRSYMDRWIPKRKLWPPSRWGPLWHRILEENVESNSGVGR